ncbi:hypothetical protein AB0O57_29045 [Streptomyces sp. NPDC091201]|uniref:hypothetical protein n=1 Tax=Streptomyces sp. NPDC091201 TaxID=3155190 RepID=UPI003440ACF0
MSAKPPISRLDALVMVLTVFLGALLIVLATLLSHLSKNTDCQAPAPQPSVSSTPAGPPAARAQP